ncbi:MAG: antibiotic biosynthesis monooxygenase [Actinobacteria bacterium]|nr:antibiotic biosynthesis monooxygenase [Actinomycetota bacterium]
MSSAAPLYLIAVIRPRPEMAAEAEVHLRRLMAGTLAEPGCVSMELVVSDEDPDTWIMLEKFRSRADWDEHMRSSHVTAGNAALAGLLRAPTELQFFTQK